MRASVLKYSSRGSEELCVGETNSVEQELRRMAIALSDAIIFFILFILLEVNVYAEGDSA